MKDFLIIANKNCITYKEFFPFIKDRVINIGYTHPGDFNQPEEDTHKSMQGLTRWFTTLSTSGKPPLVLTATYDPEKYKHYDNYDAINVDKVKDIPWDYDGVMGVPITILDHNLDDVEIEGLGNSRYNFTPTKDYKSPEKHKKNGDVINGNAINEVLAYAVPEKPENKVYYTSGGQYLEATYARILIKKNFEVIKCLNDHTPDTRAAVIEGETKYARVLIKRK